MNQNEEPTAGMWEVPSPPSVASAVWTDGNYTQHPNCSFPFRNISECFEFGKLSTITSRCELAYSGIGTEAGQKLPLN